MHFIQIGNTGIVASVIAAISLEEHDDGTPYLSVITNIGTPYEFPMNSTIKADVLAFMEVLPSRRATPETPSPRLKVSRLRRFVSRFLPKRQDAPPSGATPIPAKKLPNA